MGLISTWIGDVLGISSDERFLFCGFPVGNTLANVLRFFNC